MTYQIRSLRAECFSKSIEANKDDLRKTWKILKQAMGRYVKLPRLIISDLMIISFSDRLKISDPFNEHFVSLGERLAEEIPECVIYFRRLLIKDQEKQCITRF